MKLFTWLADKMTYDLLGMVKGAHWAGSVHFFIEDTTKIFFLLVIMIYAVAWMRAGFPIERIRDFLVSKNRFIGYLMAALFGVITPFCSCSSIPLFLGFTAARLPIGITMAFLITSPMVNEAAVVMLGGNAAVGWQLTGVYVLIGMLAGMIGGWFFDLLRADRWLEDSILMGKKSTSDCKNTPCTCQKTQSPEAQSKENPPKMALLARHIFAIAELKEVMGRIWLWVVAGIALGAGLHGLVPDHFLAEHLGTGAWWSVPVAVGIGIPTYANTTGVIPVIATLIQKGLPVGTAFAFMMSTTCASIPEFIMLKRVMSMKLLLVFGGYLLFFFTVCGWILNVLFTR